MILHPLKSTALAKPKAVILKTVEGEFTAEELLHKVEQRAAWLKQLGVKPQETVAFSGKADSDFVITFFAIGYVQAIAAPLPYRATPQELEQAIQLLQPQHILHEVSACNEIIEAPFWPLEHICLRLLTSGTQGIPKVVELSTEQIVFSAFGSAIRLGHLPTDVWLHCLPLHHIAGLSILLRCAMYGTCVVLHERFNSEDVVKALQSGEISMVSLVPTMLQDLLKITNTFHSNLRVILLGGAKASETLLQQCTKLPIALSFGMTETASQICTSEVGATTNCGAPLPFVKVDTVDGLIRVQGPIVKDHVLVTRDCGSINTQGQVEINRRQDEIIICGGENIDPYVLETALLTQAQEAVVIGVEDERLGHIPVAFVVSKQIILEQLEITAFYLPRYIVYLSELPKTSLGKIKRNSLKKLWQLQTTGQISFLPSLHINTNMHELDLSNEHILAIGNAIMHAYSMGTLVMQRQSNSQNVTELSRMLKLGMRTDNGQTKTALHERFDTPDFLQQKFFESTVAVFEKTAEKNNSSSIDIKKSNFGLKSKSHDALVIEKALKEVNHESHE